MGYEFGLRCIFSLEIFGHWDRISSFKDPGTCMRLLKQNI